jgi:hypothetical protein
MLSLLLISQLTKGPLVSLVRAFVFLASTQIPSMLVFLYQILQVVHVRELINEI